MFFSLSNFGEHCSCGKAELTCLCKMQNLEHLPHHLVPGSWHFLGVQKSAQIFTLPLGSSWQLEIMRTCNHHCSPLVVECSFNCMCAMIFLISSSEFLPNPNTHENIFTLIPSPIHIQHPPKCFQTYAFIPYIRGSLIFLWGI